MGEIKLACIIGIIALLLLPAGVWGEEDKHRVITEEELQEKLEKGNYDFSWCVFEFDVDFGNHIFKYANFHHAIFEGDVNFYNATFENGADFRDVTFEDNRIDFERAEFNGTADFDSAHFGGDTNFSNAIFYGGASFQGVVFEKAVYFERNQEEVKEETFQGQAYFVNATFKEYVSFSNVVFHYANFTNAKFQDRTFFDDAKFKLSGVFRGAEFHDYTSFSDVIFEENADFSAKEFRGSTFFSDAKFKGKETRFFTFFKDNVYFWGTIFGENGDEDVFMCSTFERILTFKPIIKCKINFGGFKAFEYVEITADLTNAKFNNAYLENVNFVNCEWLDPFIIYEEKEGKLEYEDLETIYRNLKNSFQKYGQSNLAGKAFYREMEMRRKGISVKELGQWLWLHFIWSICGYGERPLNLIIWSFVVILIFSGLFCKSGLDIENHRRYYLSLREKFKYFKFCFLYSIASFTTLGSRYIKPRGNASRWLSALESLIGAFFIALFIYVFARKMLR